MTQEINQIGIVVIQSLPKDDLQTGIVLCDEILKYKHYQKFDTNYFLWQFAPKDKSEFVFALHNILEKMEPGMIFTLHIESHGTDEGIVCANGEILSWHEFHTLIRPINVKMFHLLVVVLAMCYGGAIISTIEPEKRAPYKACISSYREVSVDEVARGFSAFYSSYTSPLDIVRGVNELQSELSSANNHFGPFHIFTSRDVFLQTFDLDRDYASKEHLINTRYVAKRYKGEMCTREDIENELRTIFKSAIDNLLPYYDFRRFKE